MQSQNPWRSETRKNEDGSYKIQAGKEFGVITIPLDQLVLNLRPEKPTIEENDGKTIVKPSEEDTDAKEVKVTYTTIDGQEQKIPATKGEDGSWSITEGAGYGRVDEKGVSLYFR